MLTTSVALGSKAGLVFQSPSWQLTIPLTLGRSHLLVISCTLFSAANISWRWNSLWGSEILLSCAVWLGLSAAAVHGCVVSSLKPEEKVLFSDLGTYFYILPIMLFPPAFSWFCRSCSVEGEP